MVLWNEYQVNGQDVFNGHVNVSAVKRVISRMSLRVQASRSARERRDAQSRLDAYQARWGKYLV